MKKFAFQIISLATVWRGFLRAGWEAAAGSRREMRVAWIREQREMDGEILSR